MYGTSACHLQLMAEIVLQIIFTVSGDWLSEEGDSFAIYMLREMMCYHWSIHYLLCLDESQHSIFLKIYSNNITRYQNNFDFLEPDRKAQLPSVPCNIFEYLSIQLTKKRKREIHFLSTVAHRELCALKMLCREREKNSQFAVCGVHKVLCLCVTV